MTVEILQSDISEGPTQDAFRGPVNAAIRRALKLHEGDMVVVRTGEIIIQRHGEASKYCPTPEPVRIWLDQLDSGQVVHPLTFEIQLK